MSSIISRTCAGGVAAAGTCAGGVWEKPGETAEKSASNANMPNRTAFKPPAMPRFMTASDEKSAAWMKQPQHFAMDTRDRCRQQAVGKPYRWLGDTDIAALERSAALAMSG
ncbi:hypothetical protein FHT72_004458 [Rhizobium sp. BK077]|uniref:hypothetical protein n=1 Tax=unclassified Rhizobium TaxID=2613769 RepID=UPI0017B3604C|nr:hypothetical protein [Rhizobium sp. BK591]MBB3369955.1 hypothetical protein [Rhizobium sp. BK077]